MANSRICTSSRVHTYTCTCYSWQNTAMCVAKPTWTSLEADYHSDGVSNICTYTSAGILVGRDLQGLLNIAHFYLMSTHWCLWGIMPYKDMLWAASTTDGFVWLDSAHTHTLRQCDWHSWSVWQQGNQLQRKVDKLQQLYTMPHCLLFSKENAAWHFIMLCCFAAKMP